MGPITLEVPDWVPHGVAGVARHIHAAIALSSDAERWTEPAGVLRRFATDRRMQEVWREFFKRQGGAARGGPFLHPARNPDGFGLSTWQGFELAQEMSVGIPEHNREQEQAVALLFLTCARFIATDRRKPSGRVRSEAQVKAEVEALMAEAARARQQAVLLFQRGIDEHGRTLLQIAAGLDQEVRRHEPYPNDPFVVGRESNLVLDSWERAFVRESAGTCEALFGERMLGTVAAIANVALGRTDLMPHSIRNAVSIPAAKAPR